MDRLRKSARSAPGSSGHILCACDPRDDGERTATAARAKAILDRLDGDAKGFARAARDNDCGSRDSGGHLGQIGPGETVPEFETALRGPPEGGITPEPVLSRHGWHIIRLNAVAPGQLLPFETVRPSIAEALEKAAWARAFVARAPIRGAILLRARASHETVSAGSSGQRGGPTDPALIARPLDFICEDHLRERQICAEIDRLAATADFDQWSGMTVLRFLNEEVRVHIRDEAEDLFPILLLRCTEEDAIDTVLDRIRHDQTEALSLLPVVRSAIVACLDTGAALSVTDRTALTRFAGPMRRHLVAENAILLPIAAPV